MHRLTPRIEKLDRYLAPPLAIRVVWSVEGGEEPVFEPGTRVLEIHWDGTSTGYIAGEPQGDASP